MRKLSSHNGSNRFTTVRQITHFVFVVLFLSTILLPQYLQHLESYTDLIENVESDSEAKEKKNREEVNTDDYLSELSDNYISKLSLRDNKNLLSFHNSILYSDVLTPPPERA